MVLHLSLIHISWGRVQSTSASPFSQRYISCTSAKEEAAPADNCLYPHLLVTGSFADVQDLSLIHIFIQTEEEIEGMPGNYTYSLFEGTGGLYRCYGTNAFALSRQLSVGINLGMIAGTDVYKRQE